MLTLTMSDLKLNHIDYNNETPNREITDKMITNQFILMLWSNETFPFTFNQQILDWIALK